jgi:DNA-binding MarR family transcriptional regulator
MAIVKISIHEAYFALLALFRRFSNRSNVYCMNHIRPYILRYMNDIAKVLHPLKQMPLSCKTSPMTGTAADRTDESLIALRRILRATEHYERSLAQASGLTPPKLRVLQIVSSRPGGSATPKALAVQMGVAQATITALIDKLEAGGLVHRARSETDRRQTNVSVTEAGRAALAGAPDALQQRFVRAFEGLADWEQAQLVSSLERVAAMLDAEDLDAAPVLAIGDIKAGQPGAR